jgi:hypothetical protein
VPLSCSFYYGIALFRCACSTPRVPRKPHPLAIFTAPTYLGPHPVSPSPFPLPLPFHYFPSVPSSPGLWLFSPFLPFPISLKPQPASTQAVVVCASFYSFVTTLILLSICAYCAHFFSSFSSLSFSFLFRLLFSVCPENNHLSFRFSFARPL